MLPASPQMTPPCRRVAHSQFNPSMKQMLLTVCPHFIFHQEKKPINQSYTRLNTLLSSCTNAINAELQAINKEFI